MNNQDFTSGKDKFGQFIDIKIFGVNQRMRWINPGSFLMGDPSLFPGNEGPQHRVTISDGFWLADTACTQELWTAVMGYNPSFFRGDDLPVENVNCPMVDKFLDKLNLNTFNHIFKLPTEAEWEYACRAGTTTPFSFGNKINEFNAKYQNFYNDVHTVYVKSFSPNGWGLYQMHGNVWEWCSDNPRQYTSADVRDPELPIVNGDTRVIRGGSFHNVSDSLKSWHRFDTVETKCHFSIGFRFLIKLRNENE